MKSLIQGSIPDIRGDKGDARRNIETCGAGVIFEAKRSNSKKDSEVGESSRVSGNRTPAREACRLDPGNMYMLNESEFSQNKESRSRLSSAKQNQKGCGRRGFITNACSARLPSMGVFRCAMFFFQATVDHRCTVRPA